MDHISSSTMNSYFKNGTEFYINRFEEPDEANKIMHFHDFLEICYVLDGSGCHVLGNRTHHVIKGDLFIVNHNIPHAFYHHKETSLITYNIMIKSKFFQDTFIDFNRFSRLSLSYLIGNISDECYLKENLRLAYAEQQIIEGIIEHIYKEYTDKNSGYLDMIHAYMTEFIIQLMRIAEQRENGKTEMSSFHIVNSVIAYLEEHYSQGLNLNELAKQSFYSKNYLCTLFKEGTGMTMSQFIQKERIKHACALLLESDYSLAEIGEIVGFSDYKAFYSTFKKEMNVSPNQYRKKLSD